MQVKTRTNKEGGKSIAILNDDGYITALITANQSNRFVLIEYNPNYCQPTLSEGLSSPEVWKNSDNRKKLINK
jgi:hypothetical protein